MNDPASNVPVSALGVRLSNNHYQDEVGQNKEMTILRLMYGLNHRITLDSRFFFSNHHSRNLPVDFIQPNGGADDGYHIHNHIGHTGKYFYQFNGIDVRAKFLYLKLDEVKRHLRAAAYVKGSMLQTAPHLAEGNLNGHNSGVGFGTMVTGLYKKIAVSLNGGMEFPTAYNTLDNATSFEYGRSTFLNLSIGYLTLPRKYDAYDQLNINLYSEFLCRWYQGAALTFGGSEVPIEAEYYPDLVGSNYVEWYPGIQAIVKSNTRFEFNVGIPLVNRSYNKYYPIYRLQVQHYIYFHKKSTVPDEGTS